MASISLHSESCYSSPAAHVNPWLGGGSGTLADGGGGGEDERVEARDCHGKGFGFGMGYRVWFLSLE